MFESCLASEELFEEVLEPFVWPFLIVAQQPGNAGLTLDHAIT